MENPLETAWVGPKVESPGWGNSVIQVDRVSVTAAAC